MIVTRKVPWEFFAEGFCRTESSKVVSIVLRKVFVDGSRKVFPEGSEERITTFGTFSFCERFCGRLPVERIPEGTRVCGRFLQKVLQKVLWKVLRTVLRKVLRKVFAEGFAEYFFAED